jgi:hypothetical protein
VEIIAVVTTRSLDEENTEDDERTDEDYSDEG